MRGKGGNIYLCEEVVAAGGEGLMSVALQRAGCQGDDNDRAFEERGVYEGILLFYFLYLALVLGLRSDGSVT